MNGYKTKTFGPNITFPDGETYPLGKIFSDFVYENEVSTELIEVDDHGESRHEIVFKDPETGNFYITEKCFHPTYGSTFFGLSGDFITCEQVEPIEVTTTIYRGIKED